MTSSSKKFFIVNIFEHNWRSSQTFTYPPPDRSNRSQKAAKLAWLNPFLFSCPSPGQENPGPGSRYSHVLEHAALKIGWFSCVITMPFYHTWGMWTFSCCFLPSPYPVASLCLRHICGQRLCLNQDPNQTRFSTSEPSAPTLRPSLGHAVHSSKKPGHSSSENASLSRCLRLLPCSIISIAVLSLSQAFSTKDL